MLVILLSLENSVCSDDSGHLYMIKEELVMFHTWQVVSQHVQGMCGWKYRGKNRWKKTGSIKMCVIPAGHVEHMPLRSQPLRVLRTINNTTFTQVYLSRFLYWIEIHLCLYASSYVNVLQFHKTLNQGNKGQYHKLFTIQ